MFITLFVCLSLELSKDEEGIINTTKEDGKINTTKEDGKGKNIIDCDSYVDRYNVY